MDICEKVFYELGNYGPVFTLFFSLFLLRKKRVFFNYYLIGYFINLLLNLFLKLLVKQSRPSVDKKEFELALKYAKNNDYLNSISYDVFGMPSGHAQTVLYSGSFIFFVMKNAVINMNISIFMFYACIILITLIQRVQYKFHTINQVIVGGIIGVVFAYIVYYMAFRNKKGQLKEKEDDNGPL